MNILLINHYAGSPEMGMEFRPYYFAREWVKMGHRVDIIAADYSHLRRLNPTVENDFDEDIIEGIHYHWVKTRKYEGNGIQRAITMFQFIFKLWNNVNKINETLKPDVVICSSTYPLDTYVGQRIRKTAKKKIKLIHEVHDMWPATLYEIGGMSKRHPFVQVMQWGENSAYRNSDRVVSLLPYAEPYMKEHGLREGKFVCIPNGVVLEEWENPGKIPEKHAERLRELKAQNKFIVGYFGGHALSNALDSLLDVAEMIEDGAVHFVLVGDGIEKNRLVEKSKEKNLDNVTFLPPVEKKSIPDLCKYFDCNIMCGKRTLLYRFGLCLNKMFDSMASGKPSLCALGVKTYFTEYHCGYDVSSEDITEICDRLHEIKSLSFNELLKIETNAKSAVQEQFNYKSLAESFLEVMKE